MLKRIFVFQGEHLDVVHVPGGTETCVVTFSSVGANKVGFAEDLCAKLNYSAFHFISHWDHWWQPNEVLDAVSLVNERIVAERFRKVLTYGASMGGYGAAMYAARLSARSAILIAPQFTIDPSKPPHETRWKREAKLIDFVRDDMRTSLDVSVTYWLVSDPYSDDRKHQIAFSISPSVRTISVPFSNHAPALVLRHAGMLRRLFEDLVNDELRIESFYRSLHLARRNSWQFWFTLAEKIGGRKAELQLQFLKLAHDSEPRNPFVSRSISDWYSRRSEWSEAVRWAEHAVQNDPAGSHSHNHLAGMYIQVRKYGEAIEHVEKALTFEPSKPLFLRRLSHLHLLVGRAEDALNTARLALSADTQDPDSLFHLAGVLAQRGERKEAESLLLECLDYKPESVGAAKLLGALRSGSAT